MLSVKKYLEDCSMNEKFNFLISFKSITNMRFEKWIMFITDFYFFAGVHLVGYFDFLQ